MIQKLSQLMPKDWLVTNRGFSLVEVILASSVFILITTALVGAIIYGQESTVLSGQRAQAVFLAEEGLEAVKNIRDDDFSNLIDGTYGLQVVGGRWNIAGSSDVIGNFTRQITISPINSDTKKITSTVTWQQNLQRSGSVSLDTYLTYWMALGTSQATDLIIDSSSSDLDALDNTKIIGLTLKNNGLADITINQMVVSWINGEGGSKINNVYLAGSSVWSGSANSGTTLNITDFTLPVGNTVYLIDFLDFNRNMTGTTITLDFIMADGSIVTATFSPGTIADITPPSAVIDLSVSNPTSDSIDLSWTAPGDDGNTGTAASYDIRYSTNPINDSNWATALQLTGEPIPQVAGTAQSATVSNLLPSTIYYLAIKTADEVPNTSLLSNVPSVATLPLSVDTTSPAAITNLTISNITLNSVLLSWTSPGDDGDTGTATTYDIRYSTSLITEANWATATQVSGEPAPLIAGTAQSLTVSGLSSNTTYYFAIKTSDEVPNTSLLSDVPSATTLAQSQADLLNVNITGAGIDSTNNKRVIGLTISNIGAADIILDQMIVSWTGAFSGTKITGITINAVSVWTGSNNSGATENISNFTLLPSVTYPLTYLIFNKNMTGTTLSINFIMLDGSTKLISNIIP